MLLMRSSDALWAFSADLRLAATKYEQDLADRTRRQVLLLAVLTGVSSLVAAPMDLLGKAPEWLSVLPLLLVCACMACALVGLVRLSLLQRRGQSRVGLDALGGPGRLPVRIWQALPWPLGPDSPDASVPEMFPAWPGFEAFTSSSQDSVVAAFHVGQYLRAVLDADSQETFAVLLAGFDASSDRAACLDDLVTVSRLV